MSTRQIYYSCAAGITGLQLRGIRHPTLVFPEEGIYIHILFFKPRSGLKTVIRIRRARRRTVHLSFMICHLNSKVFT